eukprot:4428717-Pyramimonas_sp.AAC.1
MKWSRDSRSVGRIGSSASRENTYHVSERKESNQSSSLPLRPTKSSGKLPPRGKLAFTSISGEDAPVPAPRPVPQEWTTPEKFREIAQYVHSRTLTESVVRAQYKAGILLFVYFMFYLVALMVQSDTTTAYQMTSTAQ